MGYSNVFAGFVAINKTGYLDILTSKGVCYGGVIQIITLEIFEHNLNKNS